jgi:hypothetical protein
MISHKAFIVTNNMVGKKGSPSEFGHTSATAKGPDRSIAKTDNEIGIKSHDFIAKPFEFGFVGSVDPPDGAELRPALDGLGLIAAEGFEPVAGWVEVEDVGSGDLWMGRPDRVDVVGLAGVVVELEVAEVARAKGDDFGFVEHLEEFETGRTDEALANSGFVLAVGFSH